MNYLRPLTTAISISFLFSIIGTSHAGGWGGEESGKFFGDGSTSEGGYECQAALTLQEAEGLLAKSPVLGDFVEDLFALVFYPGNITEDEENEIRMDLERMKQAFSRILVADLGVAEDLANYFYSLDRSDRRQLAMTLKKEIKGFTRDNKRNFHSSRRLLGWSAALVSSAAGSVIYIAGQEMAPFTFFYILFSGSSLFLIQEINSPRESFKLNEYFVPVEDPSSLDSVREAVREYQKPGRMHVLSGLERFFGQSPPHEEFSNFIRRYLLTGEELQIFLRVADRHDPDWMREEGASVVFRTAHPLASKDYFEQRDKEISSRLDRMGHYSASDWVPVFHAAYSNETYEAVLQVAQETIDIDSLVPLLLRSVFVDSREQQLDVYSDLAADAKHLTPTEKRVWSNHGYFKKDIRTRFLVKLVNERLSDIHTDPELANKVLVMAYKSLHSVQFAALKTAVDQIPRSTDALFSNKP